MGKIRIVSAGTNFELERLRRDTDLNLLAGISSSTWKYTFHVLEAQSKDRSYPHGVLLGTSPRGHSSELEVTLLGCVTGTISAQNPADEQEHKHTFSDGLLIVGNYLVVRAFATGVPQIIGHPHHAISSIEHDC